MSRALPDRRGRRGEPRRPGRRSGRSRTSSTEVLCRKNQLPSAPIWKSFTFGRERDEHRLAQRRQHQRVLHDDLLRLLRGLAARRRGRARERSLSSSLVELGVLEAGPGPAARLVPFRVPDLVEDQRDRASAGARTSARSRACARGRSGPARARPRPRGRCRPRAAAPAAPRRSPCGGARCSGCVSGVPSATPATP